MCGEEQAAGAALGRRGRRRRRRRAQRVLALAAPPARGERRLAARRRRCRRGDRRVPARAAAAPVRTLVFLEHHGERDHRRPRSAVLSPGRCARPRPRASSPAPGSRRSPSRPAATAPRTVFLADDERLAAPLPQPRVDVLAELVAREGFDTVLFAQSVLATDLAAGARGAARRRAELGPRRARAREGGVPVGTRPALADSVWVTVGWSSPVAPRPLPQRRARAGRAAPRRAEPRGSPSSSRERSLLAAAARGRPPRSRAAPRSRTPR